jgi:hypothetical protein
MPFMAVFAAAASAVESCWAEQNIDASSSKQSTNVDRLGMAKFWHKMKIEVHR